jgi:hypothetical protein
MLVPETTLAETIGMVPFFEGWWGTSSDQKDVRLEKRRCMQKSVCYRRRELCCPAGAAAPSQGENNGTFPNPTPAWQICQAARKPTGSWLRLTRSLVAACASLQLLKMPFLLFGLK